MKARYIIFILIAVVQIFSPIMQASENHDSITTHSKCRFDAKQLIVPGALFAVGATTLFAPTMKDLDLSINHAVNDLRGQNHRIGLDEYLRFAPIVTNYALHFSGIQSGFNTKDQLLLTATSFISMYALTQGLKHTIHKTRPDGSDSHSFPSGHVATAFLGAEQLRTNYGAWWGLAGYTMATSTAVLRLYNNRHWFGDVIGAAGIGIISARIGYWLLPWEKKLLGLDRHTSGTSFVALPTYDNFHHSYGIAVAMHF